MIARGGRGETSSDCRPRQTGRGQEGMIQVLREEQAGGRKSAGRKKALTASAGPHDKF